MEINCFLIYVTQSLESIQVIMLFQVTADCLKLVEKSVRVAVVSRWGKRPKTGQCTSWPVISRQGNNENYLLFTSSWKNLYERFMNIKEKRMFSSPCLVQNAVMNSYRNPPECCLISVEKVMRSWKKEIKRSQRRSTLLGESLNLHQAVTSLRDL